MANSATARAPHALPPRPSLIDRRTELEKALAIAAECERTERSCRIWLTGEAGIGKTTLAVTIAYRLADRATDGELYAHLRGSSSHESAEPFEILGRFLRQLGLERDDLPDTVDGRSAVLRTLTDQKRIILVLDDAGGAAHVRDLLPNSSRAVVIVTSTAEYHGIAGDFEQSRVGRFDPPFSAELLTRYIGADRVAAEPDAAARLADTCGHLPLGIEVVGAELRRHPQQRLAELSATLGSGLASLRTSRPVASPLFALTSAALRSLPPDLAGACLMLSLHQGPVLRIRVVAMMLERSAEEASQVLDALTRAVVLQRTSDGGYRFQHIVGLFLRSQAEVELLHPVQAAVIRAMVAARLEWTAGLARTLWPDRPWFGEVFTRIQPVYPADERDLAADEFEREYDNIKAAVSAALRNLLYAECVQLGLALKQWGYETGRTVDLVSVMESAATAAEALGDVALAAQTYKELGTAYEADGQFDLAEPALRKAVELGREAGDLITVASGLEWLGIVAGRRGDLDKALAQLGDARVVVRSAEFDPARRARADALLSMHFGRILAEFARPDEAERETAAALRYFEDHDEPGNVLRAALTLNDALVSRGQLQEATETLRQALAGTDGRLLRNQRMRGWRAVAANEHALGDQHAALIALARAGELARTLGLVPEELQILLDEAARYDDLSDAARAADRLQNARERSATAMGARPERVPILRTVAAAYEKLGDKAKAAECRAEADAVQQSLTTS
jgi:tetratricopeptide (TPR) repeat protein